ncbi:PKD repeat protein [Paenibacillus castaneae]|uniref:stalk domain-containing protein n=1 Tax=Paenibacillus castaneae TaxID=474957 RepID=UPI000C9C8736|nr:stalk domain-containing protein [Paenibacillus castaneae]NIK77968.1 PKD repeat protein [Paenibacillus castaneae]
MNKEKKSKRIAKRIIIASLLVSLAGAGFGSQDKINAAERQPIKITFVHGQKQMTLNGSVKQMTTPLPVVNGVTMIPIHTLASAVGAKVYNDSKGTHIDTYFNKVTLNVDMRGARRNDSYILMSSAATRINGTMHVPLSAVKQLWTGNYTFNAELKQISITIQPDPNVEPVADFKAPVEVKLGEPVEYTDLSYDLDGKIMKTEWAGRKSAYFEPGVYTVTLKVTDDDGAVSATKTQDITVTDEVMYTPYEYYLRYGNPGDKFALDAKLMNTFKEVDTIESKGGRTLYMSNAPERFFGEGLLYEDDLNDASRLFLHHRNGSEERLKIAVVATNKGTESVKLKLGNRGLAGPSVSAMQFGSAAVLRYLQGSTAREMIIEPGASVPILPELEKIIMNPTEGFSGLLDVDMDGPLTFTTLALNEFTDPVSVVSNAPLLEKVGNRGKFFDTDQYIEVNEKVGVTESKLRLGSRGDVMVGVDALTGGMTYNGGEYGAVTTVKLKSVAYGTRILLNPRAGIFQGAVSVNGKVISVPTGGHVNLSEGVLLYTHKPTGAELNSPQEVTIQYTSPGASSLPILFVFLPGKAFE